MAGERHAENEAHAETEAAAKRAKDEEGEVMAPERKQIPDAAGPADHSAPTEGIPTLGDGYPIHLVETAD